MLREGWKSLKRERLLRIPLPRWPRYSMKNGRSVGSLLNQSGPWHQNWMNTLNFFNDILLVIKSAGFSVVSTYRNKGEGPNKDSNIVPICKIPFSLFLAKRLLLTMDWERESKREPSENLWPCIMLVWISYNPSRQWARILEPTTLPKVLRWEEFVFFQGKAK